MQTYLLIGLCEPSSDDRRADFEEWFVDQHIEDTTMCPGFVRGSVYELAGAHVDGKTVSQFISVYEVEAPSYEEAEAVLNEWQANPDAWEGRATHNETGKRLSPLPLRVNGSGWYRLLKSFEGPGPS